MYARQVADGSGRSVAKAPSATAEPEKNTNGIYVALGDSVAAGIGLKDYKDSSACNRTEQSYPSLLAKEQNYKLYDFACSGASTDQGILGSQTVNDLKLTPQLDALFAIQPTPKLITMTIGANDIGWTDILARCYSGTCGNDADTRRVDVALAGLENRLGEIFSRMNAKYETNKPQLVLTGYYQLLPEGVDGCEELSGISPAELEWERAQQAKLNELLERSLAAYDAATFVPVDFTGHDICSSQPWLQAANAKAPFHPTDKGQINIVEAIR